MAAGRDEGGELVLERAGSRVGRATSEEKLYGRVYTPLPVARAALRLAGWPAPGRLLDPACGDGVFLQAAVELLAESGLPPAELRARMEELEGWDLRPEAVEACRERLRGVARRLGLGSALPRLERRDALLDGGERFAFVVGNPPYLEAKRMGAGTKAELRRRFALSTRGSFDLYAVFVERFLGALEPRGVLAFLLPNRLLVAAYAEGLRRELLGRGAVELVDLSREGVFPGASVYPVLLVLRAGERPAYRLRAWPGGEPLAELPTRTLLGREGASWPLPPGEPGERALLLRSLGPGFTSLGELARVSWTVSFHRAGLRERFVSPARPEGAVDPRPFLGGTPYAGNREVEPYRIRWRGAWIDYDLARARRLGNPFPPPELFAPPKLVLCQNARRGRAALDRRGYVLKDIFLSLRPRREGERGLLDLQWLALLLNSELFHALYEQLYGGTRKRGGYLHFLPRYLRPFPLPPPPPGGEHAGLHEALARGEASPAEAEELLRRAWGLGKAERRALEARGFPPP